VVEYAVKPSSRREDVLSPTSGDCTKPGKPNSGCRCKQYRTPQEGSCQQQCCREISRVEGTEQPKTSPVRSRSMLPTEKPRIAKPRTNVRPETVVVSVTGSTSPSSPSGFNPKATPLNQGIPTKHTAKRDFPADPGTEKHSRLSVLPRWPVGGRTIVFQGSGASG